MHVLDSERALQRLRVRSTHQTRRNGALNLHGTVLTFAHVDVCSTAITNQHGKSTLAALRTALTDISAPVKTANNT